MANEIKAKLSIRHAENGEPLPYLEVTIGEDTYHFFNDRPVPGWRQGVITERMESCAIATA